MELPDAFIVHSPQTENAAFKSESSVLAAHQKHCWSLAASAGCVTVLSMVMAKGKACLTGG